MVRPHPTSPYQSTRTPKPQHPSDEYEFRLCSKLWKLSFLTSNINSRIVLRSRCSCGLARGGKHAGRQRRGFAPLCMLLRQLRRRLVQKRSHMLKHLSNTLAKLRSVKRASCRQDHGVAAGNGAPLLSPTLLRCSFWLANAASGVATLQMLTAVVSEAHTRQLAAVVPIPIEYSSLQNPNTNPIVLVIKFWGEEESNDIWGTAASYYYRLGAVWWWMALRLWWR